MLSDGERRWFQELVNLNKRNAKRRDNNMSEARAVPKYIPRNGLCTGKVTIAGIDVLGADVLIDLQYRQDTKSGIASELIHVSSSGTNSPRFEIANNGIRIGCSFVTTAALELIVKEYEKFNKTRTHVVQP